MTLYNHYEFKHIDDNTTYLVSFNADMGDAVMDAFIQFMAGCGFSSDYVYQYLSEVAELHFDVKEKLQKLEEHLSDE